jgi:hypothetical protein
MERYDKELERIESQGKQLNVEAKQSVDKRFDEVMNKISHMKEVMMA